MYFFSFRFQPVSIWLTEFVFVEFYFLEPFTSLIASFSVRTTAAGLLVCVPDPTFLCYIALPELVSARTVNSVPLGVSDKISFQCFEFHLQGILKRRGLYGAWSFRDLLHTEDICDCKNAFYSVFKEQRLPERLFIKQASAKAEAEKLRVGGSRSCRGWEFQPPTVKYILINLGDGEFSDSLPCLIPHTQARYTANNTHRTVHSRHPFPYLD